MRADRALRREWRDNRPEYAPVNALAIDPTCESGYRRVTCADVADMTVGQLLEEVRRCHGLLRVVQRRGARFFWHATDGTPISDLAWLRGRIALVQSRLRAAAGARR